MQPNFPEAAPSNGGPLEPAPAAGPHPFYARIDGGAAPSPPVPAGFTAGPPYRPAPPFMWVPAQARRAARVMAARPRELAAVVAIVGAADLAFAHGLRGFGTAVFFALVPAILVAAARGRRFGLRLVVTTAMLTATAAHAAFAPTPSSVAFGLAALFALAVSLRERTPRLTEIVHSATTTVRTMPRRLVAFGVGLRRALGGGHAIVQVVVPALLVTLFLGLFSLANPLVARWMRALLDALALPSPLRVAFWVACGVSAMLLLRPAIRRSRVAESARLDGVVAPSTVSISRNALGALNVLFAAYNALDATYLWAGSPPPGVSERAYAHQGVAWLTLTLALLTLIVGFMFRGALAHDPRGRMARGLAYVWLGQGLVLALGTYRRMSIHITTSGLSNARLFGLGGITLVVVGLVLVAIKLRDRRSFLWLLRRQLDALAVYAFVASVMPTHFLAAKVNLAPIMAHEFQALVHVEEHARDPESAVELLPLLAHDDERIRRGVAALLLDERDALRRQTAASWSERTLASERARFRLEQASDLLEWHLGDVERVDAIRQFEYIRNSAIEGEIAQSEIRKVELPKTRAAKLVDAWIADTTSEEAYDRYVRVDGTWRRRGELANDRKWAALEGPVHLDEDQQRVIATFDLARNEPDGHRSTHHVELVLVPRFGHRWHIVEQNGTSALAPRERL